MFVLVTGGFDISVGSVAALAGVCAARAIGLLGPAGILAAPLVGLLAGLVNGVMVGHFRVQPIIATLGMLSLARGLALIVASDRVVVLDDSVDLTALAYGRLLGLPVSFWIVVALTALAAWLAASTPLGRRLYMCGSSEPAALLVGVNVRGTLVTAYALSGLSAGIAALFFLARAGAGLPTIGSGLELSAIAAAVIGGTSLSGGVGAPPLVLIGALFIQCLNNGLGLAGLSPFVKEVVLGTVIILAGLLDYGVKRLGTSTWRSRASIRRKS
jgi:ribose/xylose/arabinose/galactoside ABC-type transport system permease subunit